MEALLSLLCLLRLQMMTVPVEGPAFLNDVIKCPNSLLNGCCVVRPVTEDHCNRDKSHLCKKKMERPRFSF